MRDDFLKKEIMQFVSELGAILDEHERINDIIASRFDQLRQDFHTQKLLTITTNTTYQQLVHLIKMSLAEDA